MTHADPCVRDLTCPPVTRGMGPRGVGSLRPRMLVARADDTFYRVIAAAAILRSAEEELRAAVVDAVVAGDSWGVIGATLGTSRQSAFRRFNKHVGPLPPRLPVPREP
jgi:hypothetical protein